MKNKKLKMFILYFIAFVVIAWTVATYYVEQEGPPLLMEYGSDFTDKKTLIVFDPDPIYNLDEQICNSVALSLEKQAWNAKVVSIAKLPEIDPTGFDLYVFCANTYNWSPDRAIKNLIDDEDFFLEKKVAAITVGSGSTKRAHRILEELILSRNCDLVGSKEIWLLRPNDHNSKRSNVEIANQKAKEWGMDLSKIIN